MNQKAIDYLTKEKFKRYMLLNTSNSKIVFQSDNLKEVEAKAGLYHLNGGTPHLIVKKEKFSTVTKSYGFKEA